MEKSFALSYTIVLFLFLERLSKFASCLTKVFWKCGKLLLSLERCIIIETGKYMRYKVTQKRYSNFCNIEMDSILTKFASINFFS